MTVLRETSMSTSGSFAIGKYSAVSVSIIAVMVLGVYAGLFQVYRSNLAIDTPWYLSFSYNYCEKGIDTDATFGVPFPGGMGGTVAFGKLAAIVQCAVLAPFNWSLVAANILSLAGVALSMVAIFFFLVGEGFGRLAAATCCLALAATEPFVAMANQSKYEYITFPVAVGALVLAARRQLVLAGLVSVLAIEVQPIGIMAPIYLIAYELSRMVQTRQTRVEFGRVAKLLLGGVLGLALYFSLHPHIMALLHMSPPGAAFEDARSNFLYGYFIEARLHRHLPELVVFVVCLVVHVWRRDYLRWPFPLIASIAAFFVAFLRGNGYYIPFWYFPSFVLVFVTVGSAWRAVALPALVLLVFVPQYAIAYVEGHKYYYQKDLGVARAIIASRASNLNNVQIFGDFIFWPIFKDLSFRWTPTGKFNQAPGMSFLICGLDPPFSPEERVCADELPAFHGMQLISQFSWADRSYRIYERQD